MFTEKQITQNAPIRPLEVNYVNADIRDIDTDDGYLFHFPQNWSAHGSNKKLIGIRRLLYKPYTPKTLNFKLWLFTGEEVNDPPKLDTDENGNIVDMDEQNWEYNIHTDLWNNTTDEVNLNYDKTLQMYAGDTPFTNDIFTFTFTGEETFEEIITQIQTKINTELSDSENSNNYDIDLSEYTCKCNYDSDTLNFTMSIYLKDDITNKIPFKFGFYNDDGYVEDYAIKFLKLFNQKTNDDAIANIKIGCKSLTLTNVWNRQDLYFHASFSDSAKQIIGVNGDIWPNSNVYYGGNLNRDDFVIRFTNDTITTMIPRNGILLIQFTLIYNYTNVISM